LIFCRAIVFRPRIIEIPARRDNSSAQPCAAAPRFQPHDNVRLHSSWEDDMRLLFMFLVFAVAGQAANIGICLALEQHYSRAATLAVFFALYLGVFWLAWRLAVRLSEPRAKVSEPRVKAMDAERQQLLVFLTTAAQAPMIV